MGGTRNFPDFWQMHDLPNIPLGWGGVCPQLIGKVSAGPGIVVKSIFSAFVLDRTLPVSKYLEENGVNIVRSRKSILIVFTIYTHSLF